jgi:pyruvate dehydrogenase E1 component beta subunit
VSETTYREALRQALHDGMEADPDVVLFGEEVGVYGGAYAVTKGLLETFGHSRVRDTPISEAAIVGTAVGAAMTGLRPVAELMYVDFIGLAMDQVANQAAKIRYMFGGQVGVPMVLRTQGGTGRSAGAQHSQSLEGLLQHIPGLRIASPGTVNDAYHLLRMALRQPDPVMFLENKSLYAEKGPLDVDRPDGAWGEAVVRRRGDTITVATYSRMVAYVLQAAEQLAQHGIELEVVDLRTLNPLDIAPVAQSVARTGRAAVVSEAHTTAGVAAELAARIQEDCFDFLEEPVIRLAGEDIPIPVSPELERASIPAPETIADGLRRMV